MKRMSVICLVALAIAAGACTSSTAPKAKAITTAAPKPPTWVCTVTGRSAPVPHFSDRFSETLWIDRGDLKITNHNLDELSFGILSNPGGSPHGSSKRHVTLECSTISP